MTNKPYFVDHGSNEWVIMWSKLATHPLNEGDRFCECFFTGESWQYMGSSKNSIGVWLHHFCHRNHPKTNKRENLSVTASDTF